MGVRAKMQITRITEHAYGNTTERLIFLQPVYASDGPNKAWSEATPSGEVQIMITVPEAFDQFKTGKTYFVDFTEA